MQTLATMTSYSIENKELKLTDKDRKQTLVFVPTKFGIDATEIYNMIDEIKDYEHIRVKGLMTIAPFVDNPEENRVHFRNLHQLLLDIKSKNIDNIDMSILSMGMTNDYEVAIEEGATMVRVGTGIFGERNYNI